jgi:Tuberculosis necrotizing toxin
LSAVGLRPLAGARVPVDPPRGQRQSRCRPAVVGADTGSRIAIDKRDRDGTAGARVGANSRGPGVRTTPVRRPGSLRSYTAVRIAAASRDLRDARASDNPQQPSQLGGGSHRHARALCPALSESSPETTLKMTTQTNSRARRVISRIGQMRAELAFAQRRLLEIRTGVEPQPERDEKKMKVRSRAGRALVAVVVLLLSCSVANAYAKPERRTTCSASYYDGNPLYGPKSLPSAGPIGAMLQGYRRFAGMTPAAYLRRWYVPTSLAGTASFEAGWQYPPLGGYLLTSSGQPVEMAVTLFPGMEVDVFGGERGGTYLAPTGTPYADRAIPPQTLDNPSDPADCDYLNFRVVRPFKVESGPIAPGLGQPGFGYQYVLESSLIPHVSRPSFSPSAAVISPHRRS